MMQEETSNIKTIEHLSSLTNVVSFSCQFCC